MPAKSAVKRIPSSPKGTGQVATPTHLAQRVEHDLAQHGTPERAAGTKAYLKSNMEFVGADMAHMRGAAKSIVEAEPAMDHDRLVALVEALWARPVFECRAVAVALLERKRKVLTASDIPLLERLTRESNTWALSDWIAVHLVGPILRSNTSELRRLDKWATDELFWVRRLALICQRVDYSKGLGDWPRFVKHADAMLDEKEFFIRKAIGWMLRERGKSRPDDVVAFLEPRMHRASGLTIREGTRNLPPSHRSALGLP